MIAYYPVQYVEITNSANNVDIIRTTLSNAMEITRNRDDLMIIREKGTNVYYVMPKYDGVFTVISKEEE